MIKITAPQDLQRIQDTEIYPYIRDFLSAVLKNYPPDPSMQDEIGAIFLLERESDWQLYREMGLSQPLKATRFEWIEPVEKGYCNGYVVIDNECTINIIGKEELFTHFKEAYL